MNGQWSRSRYILSVGIMIFATGGFSGSFAVADDAQKWMDSEQVPGDMVCGPRCVQFVLKQYGKEGDLIELVREIQWPDLESGANLDSVDQALRRRGVNTRALRIDPHADFRWPYPVILHLKGQNGLGHYAVWLPSSTPEQSHVWISLSGVRVGPTKKLAESLSGAILLTSPDPITDPLSAVAIPAGQNLLFPCLALFCFCTFVALFLARSKWSFFKWAWPTNEPQEDSHV